MWVAGLDGCKSGWIAAMIRPDGSEARLLGLAHFSEVFVGADRLAVAAVDIPIGLPERSGAGGRAAENAVRPLLGQRQSSVFSVPSRAAIEATDYRQACQIALSTSDPPRKVSRQLFHIAPKIREVDCALRGDPALVARVFEVHPEVAFWRLNGDKPLAEPKKVGGAPHAPGLSLRREILLRAGMPAGLFDSPLPRGAGEDDRLDAIACLAIALRICRGLARPFPDPPERDGHGLLMAIWA
jgi:predicted RNase H-like nuclease